MTTAAEAWEPPPPNDWVRTWARVVLATLIGMGVLGWVFGDGTPAFKFGMCAVTLVIEVWGFNAAVQWARSLARDSVEGPLFYWAAMIVACAGWTIFSLYHALDLIADGMGPAATPAYVAFTCLALALPFHEWAIERVEVAPRKPVAKPVVTIPDEASGQAGRASSHASRRFAKELTRQTPQRASKRRSDGEQRIVATRGPPLSEREIIEAVGTLRSRGEVVSLRSVARFHDVPVSRVERSPGKHLLQQAA